MPNCLWCGREQEKPEYRFCVGHQKLYYQYVECDPTKEIGEIRMSVNLPPLKTWQEFFNFEATRIVDLNPGEITERIKDYKKIQDAVKAFEHACVVRLKDVVGAERHRVLIEELHYESPADSIPKFGAGEKPKKSERMSKSERAMREAAKLLGVTVEELQSHARTNTRAKYKTIEEAINVKCDKCGCSKCNDCGDCHICLSLVSCVVKE